MTAEHEQKLRDEVENACRNGGIIVVDDDFKIDATYFSEALHLAKRERAAGRAEGIRAMVTMLRAVRRATADYKFIVDDADINRIANQLIEKE